MLQNGFCKKITIIFVRLNNNMEENNQNSINIDLSNDIAQGSYVNLSIVGHSSSEFIMDFVRLMPGMPKASVTNRLIMTTAAKSCKFNLILSSRKKMMTNAPPVVNVAASPETKAFRL